MKNMKPHYNIKLIKKGGFTSARPEHYKAYGVPQKIIPTYNVGCQYHTPEGFCNASCRGPYCENHAKICGAGYRR